jgi:hypothetical protein
MVDYLNTTKYILAMFSVMLVLLLALQQKIQIWNDKFLSAVHKHQEQL